MGIWGARPLCSLQRRTHPDSGACLHAQLSSTELPLAERADVQVRSGIGRRWTQATPAVAWWGRAWGGLRARLLGAASERGPPLTCRWAGRPILHGELCSFRPLRPHDAEHRAFSLCKSRGRTGLNRASHIPHLPGSLNEALFGSGVFARVIG